MIAQRIFAIRLALTAALLLTPAIASPKAPSWAGDQSKADADLKNGQYQDAITLYQQAIAAAESGPQNAKTKGALGKMLVSEGNCLLKLHRTAEAEAAYEKAAPLSPTPGIAYFNLCATYYNTGDTAGAMAACDKAIAADPKKADAYFIKGSLLVAQSQTINGKVVPPPGTVEALNNYLELAPNGPHAGDVRQMLDYVK